MQVTFDYLKKAIKTLSSRTEWGDSHPVIPKMKRQVRDLKEGFMDPYPLEDLWDLILFWGGEESDIRILKSLSSRPKKITGKSLYEASKVLSQVSGLPVSFKGVDPHEKSPLFSQILGWAKAWKGVKNSIVKKLLGEYAKVVLTGPRGSEDASHGLRGELFLTLEKGSKRPIPVLRSYLIHESGHAFQDKQREFGSEWLSTPYGSPPFVSEYAKVNYQEDFAETFAMMVSAPRSVKSKAPLKYYDMKKRMGGKMKTSAVTEKISKSDTLALNQWAKQAFQLFATDYPALRAENVAFAVGAKAARMGLSKKQISRWLQIAYGEIWVILGGLNPGLDLKDVRKAIFKAYDVHSQ